MECLKNWNCALECPWKVLEVLAPERVRTLVYVGCEKLAICRTKCYNRLVRLKNALNKVDEITREIQNDFDGNVPLRFKRLSKDSSGTPDAKRGLNFKIRSRRIARQSRCKVVVHPMYSGFESQSQPYPIRSYKSFRNSSVWLSFDSLI